MVKLRVIMGSRFLQFCFWVIIQDLNILYVQSRFTLINNFCICLRLEKMGALDVDKVINHHEGWRLITCMWLHGGVFHLLANMLSLVVIGIRLEQEFGFGMLCYATLLSCSSIKSPILFKIYLDCT